jgi:2-phospho-L-lactate guanylyltransferase (CobY/MobA/RfbA family)
LIQFKYGPGSFTEHLNAAQNNKSRIEIVESDVFGLDLDLPEDLEILKTYNDLSLIMNQ